MIVALPQTLVVVLAPPSPFNTLFVLTGTAVEGVPVLGPRDDDDFTRETMVVDLTQWHGGRVFNPKDTQVVASASPASFTGTDSADEFAWAVDQAAAVVLPDGRLELRAAVACAGEGGQLHRIAYQVFVQTNGVNLLRFTTIPAAITIPANKSASFNLVGTVDLAPVGAPQPIDIQSDAGAVKIPPVTIPVGQLTFSVTCVIPKDTFSVGTTPLTITAASSLNTAKTVLNVTQL
jgi:hypothetical protein